MALRHRDVDGDRQEDGDVHRDDRPGPTTASARHDGVGERRRRTLKNKSRGRKTLCGVAENDPVTHLSSTTLSATKAPMVISATKT